MSVTQVLTVLTALVAIGIGVSRHQVTTWKRTNFNNATYIEDSSSLDQQRYRYPVTAESTNGERITMEILVRAGCVKSGAYPDKPGSPPLHYHKYQDELFEVMEGTMQAIVNGTVHSVEAGQKVMIPKGVHHTYWNNGTQDLFMNVSLFPAGRGEATFQTFAAIGHDYGSMAAVNPLQLLLTISDAGVVIVDVPAAVWKLIELVLPVIGRLIGLQPTYPEYVTAAAVSDAPLAAAVAAE